MGAQDRTQQIVTPQWIATLTVQQIHSRISKQVKLKEKFKTNLYIMP